VNVFDVGQLVRRADDVAEDFVGRRDGRRRGQVIDQLGRENFVGGVLSDPRGVVLVVRLRARRRAVGLLREDVRRDDKQQQQCGQCAGERVGGRACAGHEAPPSTGLKIRAADFELKARR
jgi:hypothetical protein